MTSFLRKAGLAGIAVLALAVTTSPTQTAGAQGRVRSSRSVRPSGPRLVRHYREEAAARLGPTRDRFGVDPLRYDAVRRAGLELLRTFPPQEHFILGLGRSPARIIGFLKTLSHEGEATNREVTSVAATLPASGMTSTLSEPQVQEFFRHLEEFVPADVLRGERTLVLVDKVAGGTSLTQAAGLIARYYREHGVEGKVVPAGYFAGAPQKGMVALKFPGTAVFSEAERVAEFESHSLPNGRRVEDLQTNPEHLPFRQQLLERVRADKDLDKELEASPRLRELLVRPAAESTSAAPSSRDAP